MDLQHYLEQHKFKMHIHAVVTWLSLTEGI